MSDVKKISEEQLNELQSLVGSIQNLQSQIGGIEAQKHVALHQLLANQEKLQEVQVELEKEYGKININIQDGTYEEIVEEAQTEEA
jgi:predicted component of type VI protein secretion system